MEIKDILENLGFSPAPCSGGFRMTRIYDNGDNPSSLFVSNEGKWYDFVECVGGNNLDSLVKKTLNLESEEKVKEYLENKNYQFSAPNTNIEEPIIKDCCKIFPLEDLNLLQEKHDYVMGRGISLETAKQFKAGLFSGQNNKLKERYVWVIINSKGQIIGYTGRDLTGKKKIKYKHLSSTKNWCWPCYINIKDIQEKREVIVVESPMDIESLFEIGIRNCVCSFGLQLSFSLVNLFLRLNLNKIILALNNEPDNNNRGLNGAKKMESRLLKYFDRKVVKIHLPPEKDFNFLLTSENGRSKILEWYEKR